MQIFFDKIKKPHNRKPRNGKPHNARDYCTMIISTYLFLNLILTMLKLLLLFNILKNFKNDYLLNLNSAFLFVF